MLIAGLALFAVLLAALAMHVYGNHPPAASPEQGREVAARIAPVGAVYAGDTGRAALASAEEAAKKNAVAAAPFGGSTDGKTIFGGLCNACHTTGAGGAPKIDDKAAWAPRVAQGLDTLTKHAIEGYTGKSGVMPARGGNPALTDEQVKATVEWMVSQVK